VTVVEQTEQMGTGHAVRLGLTALRGWEGTVSHSLRRRAPVEPRDRDCLGEEIAQRGQPAILTAELSDPHGYGRVIRDGQGRVVAVVEEKDASDDERRIREVNAGIYAAPAAFLRQSTGRLSPRNARASSI